MGAGEAFCSVRASKSTGSDSVRLIFPMASRIAPCEASHNCQQSQLEKAHSNRKARREACSFFERFTYRRLITASGETPQRAHRVAMPRTSARTSGSAICSVTCLQASVSPSISRATNIRSSSILVRVFMNEALASPKGGEVGEGLGLMVALRWQDRHNASQSTTTGPGSLCLSPLCRRARKTGILRACKTGQSSRAFAMSCLSGSSRKSRQTMVCAQNRTVPRAR